MRHDPNGPHIEYQGAKFQRRLGSCLASSFPGGAHPPGVDIQYTAGHYGGFCDCGPDALTVRAAVESGEIVPETEAAMDRLLVAHPDRYQAD